MQAAALDRISNLAVGLVRALLGQSNELRTLPRRYCHHTRLSLKGVPPKHIEAAVQLKLQQLAVFERTGFAYQLAGEEAEVWYWDDTQARAIFPTGSIEPWPESLWRPAPETGTLQLWRCTEGFELEARTPLGARKTRWFAQRPSDEEILRFCQDASLPPARTPPEPQTAQRLPAPQSGWRLHSSLVTPLALGTVAWVLVLLAAGMVASLEVAQILRLQQQIAAAKAESAQLKAQNLAALQVERALSELTPTLEKIREYTDTPKQTRLLGSLAATGIIGPEADVTLTEWSARGDQVTLALKIGSKARSADVLSRIEHTGLFSETSLLPDPPPGTLKVQVRFAGLQDETATEGKTS
jgi:hypothetical protein